MRADIRFVRERFAYFNTLCFEGRLPSVTLRLSSSLRTLGTLRHPRRLTGATKPSQIVLSISNRLDLDVRIVEDTIIHEMIHLHIFWNGLVDTSAHGVLFRRLMTQINLRHGRNITVKHSGSAEEKTTDRIRKPRTVIVSTLRSGERCVTVCSPHYAIRLYNELGKSPMLTGLELIATYDPVFAHYPSARTPKIYKIEPATLEAALAKAVRFEYKEGRFVPRI